MGLFSLFTNVFQGLLGVVASLTQMQTNGLSTFGTLGAQTFPKFLTNNPLPNGFPWGVLTAIASNPYTDAPITGVIRKYDFTVKRGMIAPDGYEKSVLLINGQFPGPVIEANWGDTIQVILRNQITGPEEGTALHWHGILQKATPWFDGVPAVQQCPVAPGKTFTYTFRADLYGTSWYHSHYSAQYAGGLLGPMIIHGPSNAPYDIDVGPVFITDHYHQEYFEIVQSVMKPLDQGGNPAPVSDNNLINGKGNFDCSTVADGDTAKCTNNAGNAKFKFTMGKTHRLRLINAGAEAMQRFSIDGHEMTVIANDFVPIKPYTTKVVTLGIGQRADVLVKANKGGVKSAFWMRANISTICSLGNQPFAKAAIYYEKADTTLDPTSTAWDIPDPGTCENDDLELTVPYYSLKPTMNPSTTRNLDVNFYINETGSFLWTLDDVSFRANYNKPILQLANLGKLLFDEEWNVKNFGSNSSIRVIVNNPTAVAHPMHLHGHNMFVLSAGPGDWDGTIVNPNNPQRRDVQMLPPNGHLVWQINADNPGVWPFHCHIAWHVSAGLYTNILERPLDLKNLLVMPLVMAQTCVDWAAYTASKVVAQIDSGL